jgi:RimJ/RimL family protein N-acetyltransferase
LIQIVTGRDAEITDWVGQHLDIQNFGVNISLGIALDEVIIAGVVYSQYRPDVPCLEMSIASVSPRWATRAVLHEAFALPFKQLGVGRVQVTTARKNKAARGLVERLGFVYEGMGRRAGPRGVDMALYSMLRAECRWLASTEES